MMSCTVFYHCATHQLRQILSGLDLGPITTHLHFFLHFLDLENERITLALESLSLWGKAVAVQLHEEIGAPLLYLDRPIAGHAARHVQLACSTVQLGPT